MIFSNNKKAINDITTLCRYGGGCINDVVIHLATSEMGFGGVGESGMGSYHGRNGFDAFSALNGAVKSYIFTGTPTRTIQNAWCAFCQSHPNIQPGNYYVLLQDSVLADEFRKLCSNTYTDGIQKNIEMYMTIVGNDDFDEKFKKYLQISKSE